MNAGYLHAALGHLDADAEVCIECPDGYFREVVRVSVTFDPENTPADENGSLDSPTITLEMSGEIQDEQAEAAHGIATAALEGKKTVEELRCALRAIARATHPTPETP